MRKHIEKIGSLSGKHLFVILFFITLVSAVGVIAIQKSNINLSSSLDKILIKK